MCVRVYRVQTSFCLPRQFFLPLLEPGPGSERPRPDSAARKTAGQARESHEALLRLQQGLPRCGSLRGYGRTSSDIVL